MGNQVCNLQKHIQNLHYKQRSQLSLDISTDEKPRGCGSENIICQNQDFDECSPFSKFDIKFLHSEIRASQIDSLKKREKTKTIISALKPRIVSSTRRSLIEWQQSRIANILQNIQKCSSEKNNSNFKLESIRSYIDFIINKQKKEEKFINLKISGDSFFKIRQEQITPYYTLHRKIGEGSFGSVYIGKCLVTNEVRAIKILKKKIMNEKDQKSLLSEINTLKKVDHINIIKLYDVFYFNSFFYVVTEFCEGGSLLDALRSNQIKSEKDTVLIMKQLISAVCYLHQMKIAHRDLKLENIVLVKQMNKCRQDNEKINIKLIDFGLAQQVTYCYRNESKLVGTIDYMAPQIFNGYFSTHSDVWSCGIIMCMLLMGQNPFKAKKQAQTIENIKTLEINYKKNEWNKVNSKAKNLLSQMLVKKEEKRISIEQILNHDWIKQVVGEPPKKIKSQLVINNINNFNRGSNFICYIKNFLISRELTQQTRQEMAMIFEKIDKDASGVIEKKELIQLYSLVNGASDAEIEKLIDKIDQNKSGRIDFQQFLICMTNSEILRNKNYINQAFDFLDEDKTGFIERNELVECLEGCEQDELYKILAEADFDGDGKISRQQFLQYLMQVEL